MVVATGGPHEDRLAAHLGADHLEPEDSTVELGRHRGVANEQDGVVQAADRDAHGRSLHRARRAVDHHQAAAAIVAGASTSFQPERHAPLLATCSAMFRNASDSSWRARIERPGVDRVEADRGDQLEHGGLGVGIVPGHEAVELDAIEDRIGLTRGEQGVERLHDVRLGQQRRELFRVGGGGVHLDAASAERHAVAHVDDRLATDHLADLEGDLPGARERDRQDHEIGCFGGEAGRDGGARAGRGGHVAGVMRIARRDDDLVAGMRERRGEGAADVAGTDDGDVHMSSAPCAWLDVLAHIKQTLLWKQHSTRMWSMSKPVVGGQT